MSFGVFSEFKSIDKDDFSTEISWTKKEIVEPGTEVYEGMIIGENSRDNDLTVNITKAKQMTNVRSATKDQTSVIKKPKQLTLEE